MCPRTVGTTSRLKAIRTGLRTMVLRTVITDSPRWTALIRDVPESLALAAPARSRDGGSQRAVYKRPVPRPEPPRTDCPPSYARSQDNQRRSGEDISTRGHDMYLAAMWQLHPSGGETSPAETWRSVKVQENHKGRHAPKRWKTESKEWPNVRSENPTRMGPPPTPTTIILRSTSEGKPAKVQLHVSRSQKVKQNRKNKSKKRKKIKKKAHSSREESPEVRCEMRKGK